MQKFIFSFLLLVGVQAQADIHDRINQCESMGGGSCIFDLLRELANRGGGGSVGVPEWYVGLPGESCENACIRLGRSYSSLTETVSSGDCVSLGRRFGGVSVGNLSASCSVPVNCAISREQVIYRCVSGHPASSYAGDSRICACQ
ncbi:MAG: hypothetical protein AB7F86_13200 [Bdellovibrionales bacterium]